jgi:molecular chaperone GrpE (heat shock protein)
VIQAGYMIGDRVLRPAMVAVSKMPKAQPPANDNT